MIQTRLNRKLKAEYQDLICQLLKLGKVLISYL
jgi:hypothetical protein